MKTATLFLSLLFSVAALADEVPPVCGRTPAVVSAILWSLGRAKCEEVSPTDLAKVKGLLIWPPTPGALTGLQPQDFAGLINATGISVMQSAVPRLPAGLLAPLVSLQSFTFVSEALTELPRELFRGKKALKDVRFAAPLSSVPPLLLAESERLEILYLVSTGLTGVPAEFLRENRAVREIHLRSSQALGFPAELFACCGELVELELRSPEGVSVGTGGFRGLAKLRNLELESDYGLLPVDAFADLRALDTLILAGWGALPVGIFAGAGTLRELMIHSLSRMDPGLLTGLTGLKGLSLIGRSASSGILRPKLFTLPDRAFDGLPALRLLSLAYNDLARLTPEQIAGWELLEYLDLEHNRLTDVSVLRGLTHFKPKGLVLTGNPLRMPAVCPVAPADRCVF